MNLGILTKQLWGINYIKQLQCQSFVWNIVSMHIDSLVVEFSVGVSSSCRFFWSLTGNPRSLLTFFFLIVRSSLMSVTLCGKDVTDVKHLLFMTRKRPNPEMLLVPLHQTRQGMLNNLKTLPFHTKL